MRDNPLNNNRTLLGNDTIRFDCHPGLACFTQCCRDADMYLYPYDILRMKNRLNISSEQFLERHTFSAIRDNPYFPNLMLKMSDREDKACPFLTPDGCTIYEDRPFSCRAYPLERAVARIGNASGRTACYFITHHPYCLGHKESREWTVNEWIEDQQIQLYNDMNDLWVDIDTLFRENPWGPQGMDSPAFKMAFMACFNIDKLKSFISESTFLSRFNVPQERIEKVIASDVELMKFGFDWINFFLTGTGPLASS
ncbi:YkgJ family cysteine cluster protein [Thermodesulfobacteriota bacterium]